MSRVERRAIERNKARQRAFEMQRHRFEERRQELAPRCRVRADQITEVDIQEAFQQSMAPLTEVRMNQQVPAHYLTAIAMEPWPCVLWRVPKFKASGAEGPPRFVLDHALYGMADLTTFGVEDEALAFSGLPTSTALFFPPADLSADVGLASRANYRERTWIAPESDSLQPRATARAIERPEGRALPVEEIGAYCVGQLSYPEAQGWLNITFSDTIEGSFDVFVFMSILDESLIDPQYETEGWSAVPFDAEGQLLTDGRQINAIESVVHYLLRHLNKEWLTGRDVVWRSPWWPFHDQVDRAIKQAETF